jgi:hypothetical protein
MATPEELARRTRIEPYVNHRAPNPAAAPMLKELGYTPRPASTALATNTRPNFTMPPAPSGSRELATLPAQPYKPNFIMGQSAEFAAAQKARPTVDLSGYKPAPVDPGTGAYTGPVSAKSAATTAKSMPAMPKSAGGILSKMNSTAVPRVISGAGTALGVGLEGVKVAETAMAPKSNGFDVAEQVGESSARLAGGVLGAKGGAALGALGGPLAPITVPAGAILGGIGGYMGAGKIASMGREAMGSDPREAVDRVTAPQPIQLASYSNEGRNYPSIRPNPQASPLAQMDPTSASRQDPANPLNPVASPASTSLGTIKAMRQPNGVMSFSSENISGDPTYQGSFKPSGAGVSAQNMAAADKLAARYQSPISQMAAPQGQAFAPKDTGGFGLLDKDARTQRSLMMDTQALKPGARTALSGFLKERADRPNQELARARFGFDMQDSAADREMRQQEMAQGYGLKLADLGMRGQELADNRATNAVKRDAAGLEVSAAKQLQTLRDAYLNADTPEKAASAAQKLNALQGKIQQDEYIAVNSGETVIDNMGTKLKNPDIIVNRRTGLPVSGQQQGPALPPGMTRQVGTSNGKPVYEDASGKRFMGG